MTEDRPTGNRLAIEKSTYLLQHAGHPVDWYPWGEEAFRAARLADRPIFLSIGYSTCHWCHVMAHESFANEATAALMNDLFINVKVDREERPDVDQVYMKAVQAMTRGGGGWPLSVFLTPDGRPFFGGTYFPPEDRYGRTGFPTVLRRVADIYRTRRDEVETVTGSLVAFLQREVEPAADLPGEALLQTARDRFAAQFDRAWGGFGAAPKFPRSMALSFLLRHHRRSGDPSSLEMVTLTLDRMGRGGLADQLGGGFHRYATDAQWLVPHFEKMLYDNALLARTYLEAHRLTGDERHADVARAIFTYLLRDLRAPNGGFFAAEDADSEGEEGKFYVWSRPEIDAVLGDDGPLFAASYGVTDEGNFEGNNILWRPRPLEPIARAHGLSAAELAQRLETARGKLLGARSGRVRPQRDGKVLTALNGLALGAFAFGYQTLGDPVYLDAAVAAARFVRSTLWDGKSLKARWADGQVRYDGYLDDYAFLAWGLFDLYEATFDPDWLALAFAVLDAAEAYFAAPGGGYYFARATNGELPARPQEVYDGALPSGNSIMLLGLLRRAALTGDPRFRARAEAVLRAYGAEVERSPDACPQFLSALAFYYGRPQQVVIVGAPAAAASFLEAVRRGFHPDRVILVRDPDDDRLHELAPIVRDKTAPAGQARAYICRDFTCGPPAVDPEDLLAQLSR